MHILLSRSRTVFNLECIALCHCPDRTNRGVVISEIDSVLVAHYLVGGNKSFASSHNYFRARGELLFVMLRRNHESGDKTYSLCCSFIDRNLSNASFNANLWGGSILCQSAALQIFGSITHNSSSFSRLVASSQRFMEVEENRRRECLTELRLI
jgi:hypothetical protein